VRTGLEVVDASSAPVPGGELAVADPDPLAVASGTAAWLIATSAGGSVSHLLRTDDAGVSWSAQLAWQGSAIGSPGVTVFGPDRAAIALNIWGEARVNGQRVPPSRRQAEQAHLALAHTEDGGRSWAVAGVPDETTTLAFCFANPREARLLMASRSYGDAKPWRLARTGDGGATWTEDPLPPGVFTGVAFRDAAEGYLTPDPYATGDFCAYATTDGGHTWQAQPLRPPKGVGRRLRPVLLPPRFAGDGSALITLRASLASESVPKQPPAAGLYGYVRAPGDSGWSMPAKLPTVRSWSFPDVVTRGGDGRVWAASSHDLWWAEDISGPWQHTVVPLPAGICIGALAVSGNRMVWLATTARLGGRQVGTPGRLYRSDDGGTSWNPVTVRC
jgi:hypothetical protein